MGGKVTGSARTHLSHAASPAQGAAGLAEVIVIPAAPPDAVQVVQATVIRELSERRKTAGGGRK